MANFLLTSTHLALEAERLCVKHGWDSIRGLAIGRNTWDRLIQGDGARMLTWTLDDLSDRVLLPQLRGIFECCGNEYSTPDADDIARADDEARAQP